MGRSISLRNVRLISVVATLGLLAGLSAAIAPTASASSQVVTTPQELRDAIHAANAAPGADTLTIAPDPGSAPSPWNLCTALGDPHGPYFAITDPAGLTIQGPGAGQLTLVGEPDPSGCPAEDNGGAVHLFRVDPGASLSVTGVTMSGFDGAVTVARGGILTVSDAALTGNTARDRCGSSSFCLVEGGAIFADRSTVTLTRTVVSGNHASSGGGLRAQGSTVTITDSTVSENRADDGSGSGGGLKMQGGALTIATSTISGNASGVEGGGIYNDGAILDIAGSTISDNTTFWGGGVFDGGTATATIVNSTIADNSATYAGGLATGYGSTEVIANTTIADNSAQGGIGCVGGFPTCGGGGLLSVGPNTVTLSGSIVGNASGDDCVSLGGTVADGGYNLGSDGTCGFSGSSRSGIVPLLDALGDNGGPTQTMMPQTGSPAIDAGGACSVATDQRGIPRPQGSACDVGAVELEAGPMYTLTGFAPPVNDPPAVGLAKAGQVIPLKFRVSDGGGAGVSGLTLDDVALTAEGGPCAGGPVTVDAIEQETVGSGLKDLGGGTYRFNWKTPKHDQGQCRTVTVAVGGGQLSADFRFK
jgi:hypothetical protein